MQPFQYILYLYAGTTVLSSNTFTIIVKSTLATTVKCWPRYIQTLNTWFILYMYPGMGRVSLHYNTSLECKGFPCCQLYVNIYETHSRKRSCSL